MVRIFGQKFDQYVVLKFQLFESIGDPSYTDIFKREGEIVASIGLGYVRSLLRKVDLSP